MNRSGKRSRLSTEDAEINLVPMMDIFVGLITFMILTAAFVRLGGVSVSVPHLVAKSSSVTEKSHFLRIAVEVKKDGIKLAAFSNNFETHLVEHDRMIDMSAARELSEYLQHLEANYVGLLEMAVVRIDADVIYQDAIRVMDELEGAKVIKQIVMASGGESL